MDDESKKQETHDKHEEARTGAIHAVFSFVIALALLLLGLGSVIAFVATKPDPEKKEEASLLPTVRVQPIGRGSHEVRIATQGAVRSVREVTLAAEVGGRVTSIAPEFVDGGAVTEGQVLVEIDTTNYTAALARAESGLADAQLALEQENAQAEQAALDWKKLGRGEPGDLVLRKPQIRAAEARIESAAAEVARAKEDLKRATIRAPFDARVRRAKVEAGAVVAPGTPVAELYSATDLEVRLPFTLRDFGYLESDATPEFELTATIGGELKRWPARLVRVEGEVERSTLSGHGFARVGPDAAGGLPPVGLFVEAVVPGRTLKDVVELPRSAVRGPNEVWVVEDGRLAKRHVEILRSGRHELVVRGDFRPADQLVLTRLTAPLVGMKVEQEDVSSEEK
jgi:RND family efflux transporter MFP subunit